MNFDRAADELHREEFSRLESARTPRIGAFRSMTCGGFRDEVAAMMERLNHTLITLTPWLVTMKEGRKYVTACANPTDGVPVPMPAIRRLHDAVVAAGAFNGIYVTPRGFTPEAEYYAAHAPIKLVDGALLIKSMQLSRKGLLLPRTYKAMCRQCGDIVQHSLVKDEPLPCTNGHPVAPTISRASLVPYRPPAGAPQSAALNPAPVYVLRPVGPHPTGSMPSDTKPRNMSAKAQRRRAIRTYNQRMQARVSQQPHEQNAHSVIDRGK